MRSSKFDVQIYNIFVQIFYKLHEKICMHIPVCAHDYHFYFSEPLQLSSSQTLVKKNSNPPRSIFDDETWESLLRHQIEMIGWHSI